MGDSLFKLGRHNRVFLEIWAHISTWAFMMKKWDVGSFFSRKYSRRAHRDPHEFIFFIKTSKWEKWSWWLRMTNAFILCNLLWKVQKHFAANREDSFKFMYRHKMVYLISNKGSREHIGNTDLKRVRFLNIKDRTTQLAKNLVHRIVFYNKCPEYFQSLFTKTRDIHSHYTMGSY